MTFWEWLQTKKRLDTVVGDLARDAKVDHEFPRWSSDRDEIHSYLETHARCSGVLAAFERAWLRYVKEGRDRERAPDLTLSALLDPACYAEDHEMEIRRCAPYCLHHLDDASRVIVLDREYKPVGLGIGLAVVAGRAVAFSHQDVPWIDYERYPAHHWAWNDVEKRVLKPHRLGAYLFMDGTAPWLTPEHLARYRHLLVTVFGPGGIERLARLAGLRVGEWAESRRPGLRGERRRGA